MPNLGDSCGVNGDVTLADDGSVLVCRAKRWQRVSEPPPNISGVAFRKKTLAVAGAADEDDDDELSAEDE
jgi:hypothetical protein